jgi:hypothetical protein
MEWKPTPFRGTASQNRRHYYQKLLAPNLKSKLKYLFLENSIHEKDFPFLEGGNSVFREGMY